MRFNIPLVAMALAMVTAGAAAQSTTVYVTRTSKHYHLFEDCESLSHSKHVTAVDLKDIGDRTLCGYCRLRRDAGTRKHGKEQ